MTPTQPPQYCKATILNNGTPVELDEMGIRALNDSFEQHHHHVAAAHGSVYLLRSYQSNMDFSHQFQYHGLSLSVQGTFLPTTIEIEEPAADGSTLVEIGADKKLKFAVTDLQRASQFKSEAAAQCCQETQSHQRCKNRTMMRYRVADDVFKPYCWRHKLQAVPEAKTEPVTKEE